MSFVILPTQLLPWPKSFWTKYDSVIVVEEQHYFHKGAHPLKLWLHRASMKQYFDKIPHKSKRYVEYTRDVSLPSKFTMAHPTDAAMVRKYRRGAFIDPTNFLLKVDELQDLDTSVHHAFYKRMRVKFDILMNGSLPKGNKWSYDADNRKPFPKDYSEGESFGDRFDDEEIGKAKSVAELSRHKLRIDHLPYPTNRKDALAQLRSFVRHKLDQFGPYEDALSNDVVVGYHSCLSSSLNIGLITPADVLKQVLSSNAPLQSSEGFVRQLMWREFIRMRYILHGPGDWTYLKRHTTTVPRSWYGASTGLTPLDGVIDKVLKYGYAHHIERLMVLSNYAVLLGLDHRGVRLYFRDLFIDGYDWVMLNTTMIVCSLSPIKEERYMTRCYITNGVYLKKMGLRIGKEDLDELNNLYTRFVMDNKELCKRDYRLAAQVKRLAGSARTKK